MTLLVALARLAFGFRWFVSHQLKERYKGGGSGDRSGGSGGASGAGDRVVLADAPVPDNCVRYYFEVEIISTKPAAGASGGPGIFAQLGASGGGGPGSKETLICVGLVPADSRVWGDGSYRYQSDSKVSMSSITNHVSHVFVAGAFCGWFGPEEHLRTLFSRQVGRGLLVGSRGTGHYVFSQRSLTRYGFCFGV